MPSEVLYLVDIVDWMSYREIKCFHSAEAAEKYILSYKEKIHDEGEIVATITPIVTED